MADLSGLMADLSGLMDSAVWPPKDGSRVRFSSTSYFVIFECARRRQYEWFTYYGVHVPVDTSSVWAREGPGDHCYKVDEIPRTRRHILLVL